jgi:rod shape determining protein RodA
MAHIPERRSLSRRLKPYFAVFDGPLALILFLLLCTGLFTLSSAGHDFPGRLEGQMRNMLIAFVIMWAAANVPPQTLLRLAVPVYTVGVTLLIGVAVAGVVKKGARRWLHLGVDIQPSEIMKIAMPLMLGLAAAGAASLPVAWSMMHDYQRERVMTLIDPTSDPLGKGFHIIQSTIAIGSGGVSGKGYMKGTQAYLEFIPERTTDFIFSVYSEEFGLVGNLVLLFLYLLLIGRGLMIAANAPNLFTRLLAGSITMSFFTYSFVNMGMVSGILPVVGVPLPFMSYGGTALFTLGLSSGILMSIQRHRKLVQT